MSDHPLFYEYQAALEAYQWMLHAREDLIKTATRTRDPRDIQAVRENFEVGNDLEMVLVQLRARGMRDSSEIE